MYNYNNSNIVIVFSTLLYLSCLYDAAVSKFWMHQSRNKSNVKNVSHNSLIDFFEIFDWTWWIFSFLISDIIQISAFFPGCYTANKINSIRTMYKLCLLITVNILLNVKHK